MLVQLSLLTKKAWWQCCRIPVIQYISGIIHTLFCCDLFVVVNTLRLKQNGRHFADVIFTHIFLNEKVTFLLWFSLKFVLKGPINDKSALVQIMARCWLGHKPKSEPIMVYLTDAYMRYLASIKSVFNQLFMDMCGPLSHIFRSDWVAVVLLL